MIRAKRKNSHISNRKSQMVGQIFIYILAVIVLGFVFTYGYNVIADLLNNMNTVSTAKLKGDITNMVEIISPNFSEVKIKNFEVPGTYEALCFVENFPNFPATVNTDYPLIRDSVEDRVERNAFLVKGKSSIDPFFIGDISVEGDILCIDVINNRVNLMFEGMGDHASLREAKT